MKKNLSFLRRTQLLQSLSLLCVIGMVLALIRTSAILPGISKKADEKKQQAMYEKYQQEYVRGSITDRNGTVLASSKEPQGERIYTSPNAFASLIGYHSKIYGNAGLEKLFDQELTYSKCKNKDTKKGATVKLTVDNELQTKAYQLLKDYTGSAVVLNAKTGEIIALASTPSYNVNKLEENWEKINKTEGLLTSNAFSNPAIPGSVFKLVTSAAIIDANCADDIVEDNGSLWVDGREIKNAQGKAYGTLDFKNGFKNSSNVYFMTEALKIGGEALEKAATEFMIGKQIPLDFTTLKSNFNLGDYTDNEIATTAFGQGNTTITPLHMAMITQTIANKGTMLKPYLVDSVTDGMDKETKKGQTEVLAQPVKEETAAVIADAMIETAKKYEMKTYGDGTISVAAKTGTAQRGDGTNNAWMVSYAPANDPQYVICVNHLGSTEYGIALKQTVEALYDELFDK